ncbi:putative cardiolipin synthase-like [Tropilaelaps mercedesae]|uniref:cardiolipin synthase (CMP-forming) n=1 Tax=Tropilaelaps mercedesae TaxID=418985 RepID=A0A1V9XG78_9ACAR|nr:putative cardiolipin synthase-like [Tropilaelaps mercedesae]
MEANDLLQLSNYHNSAQSLPGTIKRPADSAREQSDFAVLAGAAESIEPRRLQELCRLYQFSFQDHASSIRPLSDPTQSCGLKLFGLNSNQMIPATTYTAYANRCSEVSCNPGGEGGQQCEVFMEIRKIASAGLEARSSTVFFEEKFLYLDSLGVHVSRTFLGLLTTSSTFLPSNLIEDVVICERIEDYGIVHCLLVLVKGEPPLDVFVKCPPTLRDLVPLYNLIQDQRDARESLHGRVPAAVRDQFPALFLHGRILRCRPYAVLGIDPCGWAVREFCQDVQSTPTTLTRETLAAKRKAFQEKKLLIDRRRAQVTARVRQAKSLARQRINVYKENVMTIPNLLSVSRIVSTPLLGYWVCIGSYAPALGLFTYAAVTDLIDGQIARCWPSQQSMAGSVLDPLADKLLVGTLFLTLTYAGLIPLELTALTVARDISLMAASFCLRFRSLPEPKTLIRYFDPSIASIKFEPTFLSKANTAIQLGLAATTLGAAVFQCIDHPALTAFCWLAAATTFASGMEYIVRKDTYRYLNRSIGKADSLAMFWRRR